MLPAFIKDFTSVSPDTISNNIIESALGCLQYIGAFVEKGFFELVVIIPGGVSCMCPSFQDNDLSDISDYYAIECHVSDIFLFPTVGIFPRWELAPQAGANWEGMATEKPHETFDFGVSPCSHVFFVGPAEVYLVIPSPCINLYGIDA